MDTASIIVSVVGGTVSLGSMAVALFQWSLNRNVKTEDDSKKKLESRVDQLAKDVSTLSHADSKFEGELRQVSGQLTLLMGSINEMKAATETGRDKQADFYRGEQAKLERSLEEKLSRLETTFRQELTRVASPESIMRLNEAERRLTMLEARVPARKR